MKVGLDATPLTEPTGGISRYTTELARALVRTFPDDEYWLLSDQDFPRPDIPRLRSGSIPRTPLARRWWLFGLPREISRIGICRPSSHSKKIFFSSSPLRILAT